MRKRTLAERLWEKVNKTDTCWLWTASTNSAGYGHIKDEEDRLVRAHRVAYALEVGPIPEGLDLDHLCRVRHCVRPSHLEPVTRRENTLRGETLAAANAQKTQCSKGHEYDEANTIVQGDGKRRCRKCRNIQRRARRSYKVSEER